MACFFCVSIGIAPGWLYAFLPSEMTYQPLSLSHLALQMEVLGAAGLAYAVAWAIGLAPRETAHRLWDVDAFYRGPLSSLARWIGIIMLRLYGAAQNGFATMLRAVSGAASVLVRRFDRPYARSGFAYAHARSNRGYRACRAHCFGKYDNTGQVKTPSLFGRSRKRDLIPHQY